MIKNETKIIYYLKFVRYKTITIIKDEYKYE